MTSTVLGREDWLRAARVALYFGGPEAVRVERLAATLGVTKGSFYWHFDDRTALLEALISEWEEERNLALAELTHLSGPTALRDLIAFATPRVASSEAGEVPSDSAMFAWAANDPEVAKRVNAAEVERIALLQAIVGNDEVGEFVYLAYLGFLMRRRRVPDTGSSFPRFTHLIERIAKNAARLTQPKRSSTRAKQTVRRAN